MDFTLSKEHLLFRQMVREFVENEIKPIMQDIICATCLIQHR